MLSQRPLINLNTINFGSGEAPWIDHPSLNHNNTTIHLSPANGLPVASYQSFIEQLNHQYSITGMDCRGAWPQRSKPKRHFGIKGFAKDLIEGLESQHQDPVIGVGHSHGGLVTAAAAIERPDLFSKLIIIEGASSPNFWSDVLYQMTPKELIIQFSSIVRGSHSRRVHWESKEAFYQRYRNHSTFKRFTELDLRAYTEHGLFEREDGLFELVFDPTWESHIFCRIGFMWKFLKQITVPTLIIRAEHSILYSSVQFKENNRTLGKHIESIEIPGTYHLLTHEQPTLVTNSILQWLAK